MEYLKVLKISDGTELIFRPSGLRGSETDTLPSPITHYTSPSHITHQNPQGVYFPILKKIIKKIFLHSSLSSYSILSLIMHFTYFNLINKQ